MIQQRVLLSNTGKRRVLVYGGAFNPPTKVHEEILSMGVEYARRHAAEVWVMPSGQRRDKAIVTPYQQRLAYIQAMCDSVPHDGVILRIDTSELDQAAPTETYRTVCRLYQQYPESQFQFIFGADSTETMSSWRGGEELLATLPMLVAKRPGHTINPAAQKAVCMGEPSVVTSSTEVRRRLASGEPVDDLVSPAVLRAIMQSAAYDAV